MGDDTDTLADALERALTQAEIHRGATPAVLLAVSGGPDSLALLLAAHRIRARRRFAVATVDHGLRTQSAAEAATVAALCRDLGLSHSVLPWRHAAPPAGNLAAAARRARYDLLAHEARRLGAGMVAAAHHGDDQRETFLLARARGSTGSALAGMRAWRDLEPGLTLVRPFLDLPKADLAEAVARAGLRPVDDPSNHDIRFERTRWRQRLRDDPSLAREADRGRGHAAAERAADELRLSQAVRDALAEGILRFCGEGGIHLAPDAMRRAHLPLSRLIASAGGADAPPAAISVARLAAAMAAGEGKAATLSGARIAWTPNGVRIGREWGRGGLAAQPCGEGGATWFDRRFTVGFDGPAEPGAAWAGCGALGRGNPWHRTLPVLLRSGGEPVAVHPALSHRFSDLPALIGRAEVGWRVWADLPGPRPAPLTPPLHFAAKADQPVGNDLAATYLP